MPSYGKRSGENLETSRLDLQEVFNEVIKLFDCSILEGHRGKSKQNHYFESGRSKVKFPDGKHNKTPSEAVDACPYPVHWVSKAQLLRVTKGEASAQEIMEVLNALLKWYHFAGIVKGVGLAKGVKIRWGGDWDGDFDFADQTFDDLPHFEGED